MSTFASTPAPPYYAVIFTSQRTEGDQGYGDMADRMVELAHEQPGFLGVESARGASGFGITVSYWESTQAIANLESECRAPHRAGDRKDNVVCRLPTARGQGGARVWEIAMIGAAAAFESRMKHVLAVLFVPSVLFSATTPGPKPKLVFQYESGDIKVSIPTADEPRVTQFGAESIKAAVKYLEDGAVCWVREKSCVNCHTTGPYLSERPALIPQLGKPSEEIVADFIEFVPKEVKEVKETATKSGYKHMPGAFSAVWRSLGLAEWDKHFSLARRASTPSARSATCLSAKRPAEPS
jgi:heme-degrading monooxygenase HmoA